MNRAQIDKMLGEVVGYRSPSMDFTVPVRLLDSRLWEIHKGPDGPHADISMQTRASHKGGVEIGYPVLAMTGAHSSEKFVELLTWLRTTEYTMADLLNEQGEIKEVTDEEGFSRGILPEGSILKAVFGQHLTADYVKVRSEEKRRSGELKRAQKLRFDMFQHAVDHADELHRTLYGMGYRSSDASAIVKALGFGSTRVTVDVDLLRSLVQAAQQMSLPCADCGQITALLPCKHPVLGDCLLCSACHQQVSL